MEGAPPTSRFFGVQSNHDAPESGTAVTLPGESMATGASMDKPRLVLFRWLRPGLPPFIHQHLDEQVKCLRHHFDVVLVSEDCDYREICETHRPDLAVFESGVYAGRRNITRTSSFPEIPKVGFCNADAYCATRSVFLTDMERWGVDTFFTLAVSMAEYTPDIADRLFVWPNFVDADVYRDHGQPKNVPILFTGSQAAHYPWRSRIHSIVTEQYPCLTTPHAGWFDKQAAGRMVHGMRYAQLLNAASVAPTCGTIARDVIRKHFEIPASRTCLVTERTPSIEAAGFVDMENAVFADQDDILDKLEFLFANPDELRRITDAGFDLVHAQHTMDRRDQLLQWLRLHRAARPGERIVQTGPFEPLRLVASSSGVTNSHSISGGLDRSLLEEGQRMLTLGRLQRAEELFLRCLNYHFMPEPVLGLTRCHLYGGNPAQAATWVSKSIERELVAHFAQSPDPVDWAFFVRALLCQGNIREAVRRADQFPELAHLELDRIRRVTSLAAGREAPPAGSECERRTDRRSVHLLPHRDADSWIDDLCVMLRACGQPRLADTVLAGGVSAGGVLAGVVPGGGGAPARAEARAPEVDGAVGSGSSQPARPDVLPLLSDPPRVRLERRLRRELQARRRRRDRGTPNRVIESLAQKEDLHNALLIRASATSRSIRAVLAGLTSNPNKPEIVWLHDATPPFLPGRDRRPGERLSRRDAFERKSRQHRHRFDIVIVGKHSELAPEEHATLDGARFVVLTGINHAPSHALHSGLIEDHDYRLVTHDASHDGGFSVFRRLTRADADG